MGTEATLFKLPPRTGKTQNVAVAEGLHALIKLKATLAGVSIRDLAEPALEAIFTQGEREKLQAILDGGTAQ